jgi:hypothetical protein
MNDLRDFLRTRRRQILDAMAPLRAQIVDIQAKIQELQRQLAEVDKAASAIGMVNGLQKDRSPAKDNQTLTIKEAALKVLADYPNGLTAIEILKEINDRFGMNIVRSSLSPQLSRLKQDDRISQSGMVWSLLPPRQ